MTSAEIAATITGALAVIVILACVVYVTATRPAHAETIVPPAPELIGGSIRVTRDELRGVTCYVPYSGNGIACVADMAVVAKDGGP